MSTQSIAIQRMYRVAPTVQNALIVAVGYAVILFLLQLFSGVSYTAIGDSADNMLRFVTLPLAVGAVLLTWFAVFSGWWNDLWTDRYKLRQSGWIHIITTLILIGVLVSVVSGNILSLEPAFIVAAVLGIALVGYTEEIVFRGFVRIGGRGSGYTEFKTMLVVMAAFGIFHAFNILTGSSVLLVLPQIINAAFLGGGLYLIFRKTGLLLVPIVLHALVDFSLLTKGVVAADDPRVALGLLAVVFNIAIAVIVVVALVKMYRRGGDLERTTVRATISKTV